MKCGICACEIPDGARKCTKCGEFQSAFWRVLTGLDLKGLLALIPLVALVYAFLAERLEGKFSNLQITTISCSMENVTVFASNLGNRSAILASARFSVGGSGRRDLRIEGDELEGLFEGGASRLLTLPVAEEGSPGGLVPFDFRYNPGCTVLLIFEVVAFDQSRTEKTSTCDCPSA